MATNDYNQPIEGKDELEKMRHSSAHVLAQAVLRKYPEAKLGIGPAIETGFYYEFELPEEITQDDLKALQKEMHKIIEEELPIVQVFIPREEAFDMLHQQGQIYKTELLQEIPDEEISFYKTGSEFIDLCRGPHVAHTGKIGAFKLTTIEDTNWRGDENRPKLVRIIGAAFPTEEELDQFLKFESEKKDKDHKVLGVKREYYVFSKKIGSGLPTWLGEGTKIKNTLSQYIAKQRRKRGFIEVTTPSIAKIELFKETGHLEFYQDLNINPFKIGKSQYMLRPMSTPSHIDVYRHKRHGHSGLPYKIFEFADVYRDEPEGDLAGMTRSRQFQIDASHVFCKEDDVIEQLQDLLNFTLSILKSFGFKDYRLHFARRDTKNLANYLGTEESWRKSEEFLIRALEKTKLVAREALGDAEFYGPKIDFVIKDIFGKEWQLSTIHMDMVTPARCKLNYIEKSGREAVPYLIHHSLIGSLERFMAILLEHYNGELPLWLAPTQLRVCSVSEKHNKYAQEVKNEFDKLGVRADLNLEPETLQNKIREAQLQAIPYIIIIGKQEEMSQVVSVRPRNGEYLGIMSINEFMSKFNQEIESMR